MNPGSGSPLRAYYLSLTDYFRAAPQAVDAPHLEVQLPPATSARLDLGLRRFARTPTYAFPWHSDRVPVALPSPDFA